MHASLFLIKNILLKLNPFINPFPMLKSREEEPPYTLTLYHKSFPCNSLIYHFSSAHLYQLPVLLQSRQSEDALQPRRTPQPPYTLAPNVGALVGLSELGALRQAGVARTLEKRDPVFPYICNIPGCCWYLEGLYLDETNQQARRFG